MEVGGTRRSQSTSETGDGYQEIGMNGRELRNNMWKLSVKSILQGVLTKVTGHISVVLLFS